MRTFLVCYDLAQPAFNKAAVVAAITSVGASWARPLDNVWYLRTDTDQGDLESTLRDAIDTDDGLLIQAVREEAVLLNTNLRWFRQRRVSGSDGGPADNVVPFPGATAANDDDFGVAVRAAS
jgi:hypothetical protein